jgi:hypothetical protein
VTAPSIDSLDDLLLLELRRVLAVALSELERFRSEFSRLEAEVATQGDVISELKLTVAARDGKIVEQAEEIARLKGLPPRPKFKGKPSGMEAWTSKPLLGKKPTPCAPRTKGRKPGRGAKRDRLKVTAEVKLKALGVPAGSRFKGYEDVTVQDLLISVGVTLYRRERWETPDGERIVADLPRGIEGGFGPALRQFIAAAHFQGQVTSERLTALLIGMGLYISKRQVVRFLSQGLKDLVAEDQDVLKAGLETAAWITVDDTCARHANQDEFTTQFGDDRFAVFRTGPTKSRRRFLYDLQCGREDFIIDEEALAYMRRLHLPAPLVARLRAHPVKRFTGEAAFKAHLDALGSRRKAANPSEISERAAWNSNHWFTLTAQRHSHRPLAHPGKVFPVGQAQGLSLFSLSILSI